ncbi:MAG TPA: hypothetical protein VJB90_00670 [Candidatus Nanoarchaeia archaeon]|nr:hypothetical protein [Candidatus Nanoarchaeia archaeon]
MIGSTMTIDDVLSTARILSLKPVEVIGMHTVHPDEYASRYLIEAKREGHSRARFYLSRPDSTNFERIHPEYAIKLLESHVPFTEGTHCRYGTCYVSGLRI